MVLNFKLSIFYLEPTIENTFTKIMKVKGEEYQVTLVDTAGQDE